MKKTRTSRGIKRRNNLKKKHTRLHLKIFVALSALFVLLSSTVVLSNKNQSARIASIDESVSAPKNSIQLGVFYPSQTPSPTLTPTSPPIPTATPTPRPNIPTATPTPTTPPPVTYCPPDTPHDYACTCIPSEVPTHACERMFDRLDPGSGLSFPDLYLCINDAGCAPLNLGRCLPTCLGKPVIYLYPTVDTFVNVQVKTEGQITVSDPLYPNGGWQQVLAHPGGKLDYEGKTYSELFYETGVGSVNQPETGIIIPLAKLEEKLREEITLLGLTKTSEQQEFLDWWIPRLRGLNAPYILFSVLNSSEKTRLDDVHISPKPDTFIDFIAYFKPLQKIEPVQELRITPAPKRQGFTAIEWGGIIDNN